MPSASVVKELDCVTCGKSLVQQGKVKCPRCRQQVELPASLPEGKWSCSKCPAHGETPHVLAVDGKIKCRWCKEENNLIRKEKEGRMRETDYPREKITILLEKALELTQAGKIRWVYDLPQMGAEEYKTRIDDKDITIVDDNFLMGGMRLWISLPTGEEAQFGLPWFSPERKLAKEIIEVYEKQR